MPKQVASRCPGCICTITVVDCTHSTIDDRLHRYRPGRITAILDRLRQVIDGTVENLVRVPPKRLVSGLAACHQLAPFTFSQRELGSPT